MRVLMVGVDKNRIGGMWTVASNYINNETFNRNVCLYYVATSTCGSKLRRVYKMAEGYLQILFHLLFHKVDIVHLHMAEKGSVYRKGLVVYLSKLFHKKVIIQMHAGPIMHWYNTLSHKQRWIVKKIFDLSDRMLVLGEFWKEQLQTIVSDKKIRILYNGSECPTRNPYNVNGENIVFMGLLKKEKGVYDLINAIEQIHKNLPENVKFVLCGKDANNSVTNYVEKKGLQNRIQLPGWIDVEQRRILFEETQICILPSYFEALSMTVIEAMCYGIPMITTNISTMSELLGQEIDLVEPGDVDALAKQILKWTQDPELRKKLSEIEFERAKTLFSVERMIDMTLCLYREL